MHLNSAAAGGARSVAMQQQGCLRVSHLVNDVTTRLVMTTTTHLSINMSELGDGGALALSQQLQQAHARIDAQTEALRDAAEVIERERARASRAEHTCELLGHHCKSLEAELRIMARQLQDARQHLSARDRAWAEHESLDDAMQRTTADAQQTQTNAKLAVEAAKMELIQSQTETEKAKAEAQEKADQAERWLAKLAETQERERSLNAVAVARLTEIEHLQRQKAQLEANQSTWNKERNVLLQEVDKNASTVIRRREELYFTRTNLLKETLRLRSEIERLPTHSLPASSRYQPVPSPPTG